MELSSGAGTSNTHQKVKLHDAHLQYLSDTATQFLQHSPTTPAAGAAHLVRGHFNGLLLDDPGDRLSQWGSGEGAWVGPVIPAGGQQAGGLEGAHGHPCILRDRGHRLHQAEMGGAEAQGGRQRLYLSLRDVASQG